MSTADKINATVASVLELSHHDRLEAIKQINAQNGGQLLLDLITSLTLVECKKLIDQMQATLGVDFSSISASSSKSSQKEEVAVEQSKNIVLSSFADGKKLPMTKLLKELKNLSITDIKAILEKLPYVIEENVSPTRFEEIRLQFEAAGGKVEYK